jgi:ribosomal protein L44E
MLTWWSLFRLAQIRFVNIFQDDDLRHNNLINFALWKSRYIWSAIDKSDIVLSLDINVKKKILFSRASNFRNLIQNEFISRFKRFFIFLLTDQDLWRELWNRLDDRVREDYFRLNIFFSEEALSINDVNHMKELRECVHLQLNDDIECQKIAFALLVSILFFELNFISIFNNEKYHCQDIIRCRLENIVICEALTRIHSMILTFMTNSEILSYFDLDQDLCRNCHQFKKHVKFVIRHSNEFITLFMHSVLREKRKISVFSQNMQWFIAQQRLNSSFEWSSIDYRLDCDECKKRKSTSTEDLFRRKRVRLVWDIDEAFRE